MTEEQVQTQQKEIKGLDLILRAIEFSPLTPKVREKIKKTLEPNATRLNHLYHDEQLQAPELGDRINQITIYIMEIIGPIMEEDGVPQANGRNTCRHIYDALGGRGHLSEYELVDYTWDLK